MDGIEKDYGVRLSVPTDVEGDAVRFFAKPGVRAMILEELSCELKFRVDDGLPMETMSPPSLLNLVGDVNLDSGIPNEIPRTSQAAASDASGGFVMELDQRKTLQDATWF